jgi:hypothetical protein
MTAIFLNDYPGFLLWCQRNNSVWLRFDMNAANFNAFAEYITSIYNCQTLLTGMDYMGKLNQQVNKGNKGKKNALLLHTTRMSIIHTI